jgi:hypothetical protein
MTNIDLHPSRNNPGLTEFFKQHILKRIEEQNGKYGLTWRLIRRYCLAKKAGGKLYLSTAKVPGVGPRGRCGWHGGTGKSGPKTAEGKQRIAEAQKLRCQIRVKLAHLTYIIEFLTRFPNQPGIVL